MEECDKCYQEILLENDPRCTCPEDESSLCGWCVLQDTSWTRVATKEAYDYLEPSISSGAQEDDEVFTPYFMEGIAHVTDGDGIKLIGRNIRLDGIDAPEWDQTALNGNGDKIDIGTICKIALINIIEDRRVRVHIKGMDVYGRYLGVVFLNDENINSYMVRNGFAIAAYNDDYRDEETRAEADNIGIWNYAMINPQRHRELQKDFAD